MYEKRVNVRNVLYRQVVTGSCSLLQCVAVCCSVLQCVAVWCSVLQYVAVCCGVFRCSGLAGGDR